jgi:spermidine/putrescine ABC transporter ATP-binding subunit
LAPNGAPDGAPDIRVTGLTKTYGDVVAVDGIDLEVQAGEFFTMLGPSGSGKTTTLRMIAGFEIPDSGSIELAGDDVSRLPPYDRPVNTVFQDYALFPHMTVQQNVEYGLMVKKVGKGERRERAGQALEMVRLSGFGDRKPSQLSGGQRQRVALARAIVNRPRVLLLDEPLGALDLKLRQEMQIELKSIQREVGITFVYVTHDQEEALTMSDRLAVMSNGRVEQIGTPSEVYEEPSTAYVADFLGVSNLMDADAEGTDGEARCRIQLGDFELAAARGDADARGDVKIVIRPERVRLEEGGAKGENRIPGMVERVVYVGSTMQVIVHLASGPTLQAWVQNQGDGVPYAQGHPVTVHLPPDALRVLVDTSAPFGGNGSGA